MQRKEFEEIVVEALENLPQKFKSKLKNISIVIEENDSHHTAENNYSQRLRLGLYQGVPLTKRFGRSSKMPDKITLYKEAIEKISRDEKELKKNIRRVILHELGHYFGLDDKKLKELGY